MEALWILIGFIVGYLVGSVQLGYVFGKMKGEDMRERGSGSTGGTNIGRLYGWRFGVPVIMADSLKCFVLSAISYWIIKSDWLTMAVILAVAVGHIYPCFLGFRGGKGVACLVGGLLPLFAWMSLPLFGTWMAIFLITKKMSLTNLIMVLFVPFVLWFSQNSLLYGSFGIGVVVIVYFSHRENIGRLWRGKEPKTEFGF